MWCGNCKCMSGVPRRPPLPPQWCVTGQTSVASVEPSRPRCAEPPWLRSSRGTTQMVGISAPVAAPASSSGAIAPPRSVALQRAPTSTKPVRSRRAEASLNSTSQGASTPSPSSAPAVAAGSFRARGFQDDDERRSTPSSSSPRSLHPALREHRVLARPEAPVGRLLAMTAGRRARVWHRWREHERRRSRAPQPIRLDHSLGRQRAYQVARTSCQRRRPCRRGICSGSRGGRRAAANGPS